MNLKANLLKKSQISFTLMSSSKMIQKRVPFTMQCYAGKKRTKMAIFHLCALIQKSGSNFNLRSPDAYLVLSYLIATVQTAID